MVKIVIYTTDYCPFCDMAKKLLSDKGQIFTEIRVDLDAKKRQEMVERSGRMTVPQIFIGDTHVGGFDDLAALESAGKLDALLE